jgi:hypothetical protein
MRELPAEHLRLTSGNCVFALLLFTFYRQIWLISMVRYVGKDGELFFMDLFASLAMS